jgi:hypothetical protein
MTITGIYIVVLVLVLIASMFGLFFTRHQRLEFGAAAWLFRAGI